MGPGTRHKNYRLTMAAASHTEHSHACRDIAAHRRRPHMPRHTTIGSGTPRLYPMARSPQLARARLYLEQAAPHPRRCPPADVESLRVPPSRRAPQSGTRLRRHRAAPLGRRPSVSSHRKGGRRAHRAAPIFGRPQSGRPSDHRAVAAAHHARCRRQRDARVDHLESTTEIPAWQRWRGPVGCATAGWRDPRCAARGGHPTA